MGLLSNDYYQKMLQEATAQRPSPSTVPVAPPPSTPDRATIQPSSGPLTVPGVPNQEARKLGPRTQPDISVERQVSRFGAPVGSPEYYRYKSEHPYTSFLGQQIGSSFGMEFPDQETWDKMTRLDQASHIGYSATVAGIKMLFDLPKEIVKAPIRVAVSIAQPWVKLAQGKSPTLDALASEKTLTLPWLGSVPTYWQSFKEARDSGVGSTGATALTGFLALGDITMTGALAESVTKAFQPRHALKPGEKVTNVAPIKQALVEEQGRLRTITQKKGSTAEYYTLPKMVARERYNAPTGTVLLKMTPAGKDSIEISVVQLRGGKIPRAVDYIKETFGAQNKIYEGDFGPELKLDSTIIPIRKAISQPLLKKPVIPFGSRLEEMQFQLKSLDESLKQHPAYPLTKYASKTTGTLPEVTGEQTMKSLTGSGKTVKTSEFARRGDDIVNELGFPDVEAATAAFDELVKMRETLPKVRSEIQAQIASEKERLAAMKITGPEARSLEKVAKEFSESTTEAQLNAMIEAMQQKTLPSIPAGAYKGFEIKPISKIEIDNLNLIGKVNGISSEIQEAVIRTISGKKAIGELTQEEYVNAAQTLSKMNNVSKYAPGAPEPFIFTQYGSPQRHWMRSYEERSGIPLYSEVYVPLEDATRLRDMFRDIYRNEARDIFGKYAKAGYGEERRLLKSYMEGNREIITANEALTADVKTDLIQIATKLRDLYDRAGANLNVPPEIFLKDYQPYIQDIGGVYQLYKEGSTIPKQLQFFAKFKRHGSLNVQLDDALALFDIYVNAGSNTMFLNPALKRIASLGRKLPDTLQSSVRSYVLEKLGYAGRIEQFLDRFGNTINRHLGTNLPQDVSRQMTQLLMDTTYSGALGLNPGTVLRNALQYDLVAYPRLGPKFYTQAARQALTKEGFAYARSKGFFVDLGVPYGEELAKDITLFGKAGNLYRKGSQMTLQPFALADSAGRARVVWQFKYQFDDAVSRYNAGKITWDQFEREIDMQAFSPIDRNIARQKIIKGDSEAALDHLTRDILDDTQFPYRRGASSRVTYGLAGRLGTQFQQWSIEFSHTLARWVRTGQYDKMIRFWAVSSAVSRTFKDVFGLDFTKDVFFGPIRPDISPFLQAASDVIGILRGYKNSNAEDMEAAKDNLTRRLKSLGRPVGVEWTNWSRFWRSYNKGPVGPNGEYGSFDDRGRLLYYTTFSDLWWQLWGFPTEKREAERSLQKELVNKKFYYTEAKQRVLELYQQEKYEEANGLIEQYGIRLDPGDFDKYYIPLTQRTFNSLPQSIRMQFAPRVFEGAVK